MNNTIFNNAISTEACAEIESITHYTEYRINFWDRITDYVGYAIATAIVVTPFAFGIFANVTGVI